MEETERKALLVRSHSAEEHGETTDSYSCQHGGRSNTLPDYGTVVQDLHDKHGGSFNFKSDPRLNVAIAQEDSERCNDDNVCGTRSPCYSDTAQAPDGYDTSQPPHTGKGALSETQVFRARLLSALMLTMYMAANMGALPLTSQYVYLRLMPHYVNESDNSTVDTSPCTANASDPKVEAQAELQAAVSRELLYFTLAGTGPMILATVVLGSYSDVIGRKVLFLLPTLAGFVKMIATALIIRLELGMTYFYAVNVVEGFSGSFAGLLLATFAYTADLTAPTRTRTLAIAILEASLAIASAASDVGVGYFIQYVNYFYAALLMASFMGMSVAMVFALPETVMRTEASLSRNPFSYVKEIFAFYFSAGTVRRRVQFLVALTMLFLSLLAFLGRAPVEVLFELNKPFCWGSVTIGIYGGVSVMARALGSVISVHLMQRCLSDSAIAAITLLTGAAVNILYGCAKSSAWLYCSVPVGAISNAAVPVTRAILSKMAGASKQGSLFASIAVTETLCMLASSSVFNSVYQATVAHTPGAVFLLMAGIIVVNFLLVLVFMRISAGQSLVSEGDVLKTSIQADQVVDQTNGHSRQ